MISSTLSHTPVIRQTSHRSIRTKFLKSRKSKAKSCQCVTSSMIAGNSRIMVDADTAPTRPTTTSMFGMTAASTTGTLEIHTTSDNKPSHFNFIVRKLDQLIDDDCSNFLKSYTGCKLSTPSPT